jgi:hypothetical protein
MGIRPSDDPKADKLQNSNMPQPTDQPVTTDNQPVPPSSTGVDLNAERDKIFNDTMDSLSKSVDDIIQNASGGDSGGS